MIKKLLCLFVSLSLLSACDSDDPTPTPAENASVTVMAYLVADNNLNSYLYSNIQTMFEGLSGMDKAATLLVYWDGKSEIQGNDTPVILRYERDEKGKINGKSKKEWQTLEDVVDLAEVVKVYPDQLSTDKVVMSQVLKDMVDIAPTEKVGLVAGSHGSAWTNSIFFSRSFGQDGSYSDNTILTADMAEAIRSTGKKFEFLLFDACNMGTVEVCYDFKDAVRYQIVSVMEIPSYGFPYENMLGNLFEGTVAGYTSACKSYIDYYRNIYETSTISSAWGTIALVDSEKMDEITALVKEQLQTYQTELADFNPIILQEYGRLGAQYIAFDLEQFIKELNNGSVPANVDSSLNELILYADCLEESRKSSGDYDVDRANFCGIGLYIPNKYTVGWYTNFAETAWYSAVGWGDVTFSWE